ncbi:MAG: FliI/YscN family ATPase [Planctomycetota bacterium]|nr:FliI/YscN family ATPase [Planctomycetota bacterium]
MTVELDKYRLKLDGLKLASCRGRVVRVAGQTIEANGPPVGTGQLCEIRLADGRRVQAEVVGFHGPRRVLLPFEGIDGIAPNDEVVASSALRRVALGGKMLGRVLDGLCRPIDGKGPLEGEDRRPLDALPPSPLSRRQITGPLALGVRVFDGVLTIGKGQRIGIFAGSGVGKSTLLGWIARSSAADVNVLALVGERGREVRGFLEDSLGEAGLAKSVVIVATADASPIQRVKAAFAAVTIAEYFRDQGRDVMFMMDSLTRFCQAQREIGLAAGEPPTTKGYCPSVFSMLPRLTERMGLAAQGSITGILTVLVEGDDMNDPVADSARSLLDGHVVLTRKLAEQGHYPAVDILQSVSRLTTSVCSKAHQQAAQRLRAMVSTYLGAEDLINIGALVPGNNRRIDKAVSLIDRVNQFLVQGVDESTDFEQTVGWLTEIAKGWEFPSQEPDGRGGGKRG